MRGDFGVLDCQALKDADLSVTYAEGASLVADHGFTTGQVGLRSFEKLLLPTAMKIGVEAGWAATRRKLPENERTLTVVPDQFRHEIATAFNLRGRGLLLLTSCSHRGVVNAIQQAQAASRIEKVHAPIGGFHLAPYQDDYVQQTIVQQTIAALKELNIHYVIPCTAQARRSTARPGHRCPGRYCAPIPARVSCSREADRRGSPGKEPPASDCPAAGAFRH